MKTEEIIKKKAKEKRITIDEVAKVINVSKPTFYKKMKDDSFTYREQMKLINKGVL